MQAALLLTCSQVAHVLITIEMAIWVHNRNGDEERIVLSQEAQAVRREIQTTGKCFKCYSYSMNSRNDMIVCDENRIRKKFNSRNTRNMLY